jgi:hypothetical protein
MLCTCSNFVFHWPDTWPYSRNLMAKKKASINSSHSAFSKEEMSLLLNVLITEVVIVT